MVTVTGLASSVTRMNCTVVAEAIWPPISSATGRFKLSLVLNSRNDVAVLIDVIVTVVVAFAVEVAVPLCTVARLKQDFEIAFCEAFVDVVKLAFAISVPATRAVPTNAHPQPNIATRARNEHRDHDLINPTLPPATAAPTRSNPPTGRHTRLYAEGRLLLDELVTRTMPLERVADAFAAMMDGTTDARTVLTLV